MFMSEYLSEVLHIEISRKKYADAEKLPLILRGQFRFDLLSVNSVECLAAAPKENISLPAMKKHYIELQKLSGLPCIYELSSISKYAEQRLMNEGIAFYVIDGTVYLPFGGIFLPKTGPRAIVEADRLSFLAQRLLLTALYQKWEQLTLLEIAEWLAVTPMSVTRALDEIEGIGLPFHNRKGRRRFFSRPVDDKEYFAAIEPYLRNPVKKTLRLAYMPKKELRLGGISAVCHYSMLADNTYPTFALTQQELRGFPPDELAVIPKDGEPAAILQIVGYMLDDYDKKAIDPISAILSLSDKEKNDDRVALAIEQIKEKV